MEPEFERMQRANEALESWVRDLLSENKELRRRLMLSPERENDRASAQPDGHAQAAA